MVALGAFQSDTQEQLADDGRDFIGFAAIPEQRHRAVPPSAALGRDQFADELVVRFVLAEAVANPVVVVQHSLDADAVRIGPQQIGPFGRPVVGVLGAFQQPIDCLVAFGRIGTSEELASLFGGGQASDKVERHPAEETGVIHGLGRDDTKRLQLLPNQLVDKVAARQT